MKLLLLALVAALVLPLVACSKKSEKCTYNGQDMPCDEFRRLTKPQPTATPFEQVDSVDTSDESAEAEDAPAAQDSKKAQQECVEAASELYPGSDKFEALCKVASEKTVACIKGSAEVQFDASAAVQMCQDVE